MSTTRKISKAFADQKELPRLTSSTHLLAQTFHPAELKIGKKLGEGGGGTVYAATYRDEKVAIKEFDTVEHFVNESKIAAQFVSANIVTPLGRCFYPHYLILELAPLGSLASFIPEKTLVFGSRIRLALDICKGIEDMHLGKMVHRDLKPGNILIFRDKRNRFRAKLTDFSLTEPIDSNSRLCTFLYKAPELFKPGALLKSEAADIYALGFVLLYLLSKKDEYDEYLFRFDEETPVNTANKSNGVILRAVNKMINHLIKHGRCTESLAKLIFSCVNSNPLLRPDLKQIKEQLVLLAQPVKDNAGLLKYVTPIAIQSEQAFYWVERGFSNVLMTSKLSAIEMNQLQALYSVADAEAQSKVQSLTKKWTSNSSHLVNDVALRSLANRESNLGLIQLACQYHVDSDHVGAVFFFRSYRERMIHEVTGLRQLSDDKENPVELIESFLAGNRVL